ncbi:HxlR family transcriptional regulator [Planctomyces bekefii]|uniref:HxlR family transcriptional regulator n=1 Tax=Planctomyces bekefii TaxID=1653850 RepID=A0A5C6M9Z9_9PLAN|nr:HxlR family transcriptional regulator [Planctomyces bekefii]
MKSYNQMCGIACALDIVGDRWTLLILRELLLGELSFGELHKSLGELPTNLLAQRLKHLQKYSLVEKRQGSGRQTLYALTSEGQSVEPILFALGAWGFKFLKPNSKKARRNLRWALTSFKRRIRPISRNFMLQVRARDTAQSFLVFEKDGRIYVSSGQTPVADLNIEGNSEDLIRVVAQCPPRASDQTGVTATGDESIWTTLAMAIQKSGTSVAI